MILPACERARLRAEIDRAVRARVEAENRLLLADRGVGADLCSGCGMPRSDWTPACKTCWNRHRNWQRRRRNYPYAGGPDELLARRVRIIGTQLMIDGVRAKIEENRQALTIGWKIVA